ncbi:MAG: hypothetical protein KAT75_10240 [Dehalococcoidia bacterium]|nr:hypothetical protein [Dehalococcoidia bacterium]
MVRKFVKIGLLFLVLALTLAGIGVGYAMWDKTLYIDGTVSTGEVNMEIISVAPDDLGIDPGHDKDVGNTTAVIDPGAQSITVTINNGYPCYTVFVHFTVHNNGTIPVKLQAINVTAPPEITVDGWNGIGEQIDPCEKRDNTISVHVEQIADELATYTFTVEFYYVQWNEYTPPA